MQLKDECQFSRSCHLKWKPTPSSTLRTLPSLKLLTVILLTLPLTGNTLQFHTSNLNSGRPRLVLYQGKTRHEVIGRSCPLGIAFIKPQLFSCACVTGVWAFYDIMCAAPLHIVGGVNHCFKMPLNTYIQEVLLVSNPSRAHGDSLTFFHTDMESIENKFFRETHSMNPTSNNIMSVGQTWTLKNSNGFQACLDSSKHEIYEESFDYQTPSMTPITAYCHFSNASSIIRNIDSVSPGCVNIRRKIRPENCYPFLESNSEEICTDLGLLEAYELAIEQENNDLTYSNKTREFLRLLKFKPPKQVSNSTRNKKSQEVLDQISKIDPVVNSLLKDDLSASSTHRASRTNRKMKSNQSRKSPHNRSKHGKSVSNHGSSLHRNAVGNDQVNTSDSNEAVEVSTTKTPEEIAKIYQETVKNEKDFLAFGAVRGDKVILANVWAYQHEQMKLALKFKTNPTVKNNKANIYKLLDTARRVLDRQCRAIPEGFLKLALDTFIKIQQEEFRWNTPYTGNIDVIQVLFEGCIGNAQAYNFGNQSESRCDKKIPTTVVIKNESKPLHIQDNYRSQGFEPLIETVWKMTVHALVFCYNSLALDVPAHARLSINFHRIFTNQIHRIWFRGDAKNSEATGTGTGTIQPKSEAETPVEYGGVLGDTNRILRDIDLCMTAASLTLAPRRLRYSRPPFKPGPGWVPPDSNEDDYSSVVTTAKSTTLDSDPQGERKSRNIIPSSLLYQSDKIQFANQTFDISTNTTSNSSENLNTSQIFINPSPHDEPSVTPKSTSSSSFSIIPVPGQNASVKLATFANSSLQDKTDSSKQDVVPGSVKSNGFQAAVSVSTTPSTLVTTANVQNITVKNNELSSSSKGNKGTMNAHSSEENSSESKSSENANEPGEKTIEIHSSASTKETKNENPNKKARPKRSPVASSVQPNKSWKDQRTILGIAYCLKKFDEPRVHLGHHCDH